MSKETVTETNHIDIPDYLYRFEEMHDAMKLSIENIDKVISQQTQLINIVEDSGKEELQDFVEDSKKQLEQLEEQKQKLIVRSILLAKVIEDSRNNEDVKSTVSILAEILGMFNN